MLQKKQLVQIKTAASVKQIAFSKTANSINNWFNKLLINYQCPNQNKKLFQKPTANAPTLTRSKRLREMAIASVCN